MFTWPTFVTQTGEFSAVTWAYHSSFVTPDKPAWLRINFHSGKLSTLCDAVSLFPPAPTLTSRCVTSRSNVAKGLVKKYRAGVGRSISKCGG